MIQGERNKVEQGTEIRVKDIAGLTCDSRKVEPGFLFAALPGTRADGLNFIPEAIKRGAVAILAPPGARIDSPDRKVPLLIDDNPRRRFALMAARFFEKQPSRVAAVTGTNGKTSVVLFTRQIWERLGHKAASMGTLGVSAPGAAPGVASGLETSGSLTTPDPVALHRALKELAESGVDYLAMEASSHGLHQYRLDGVKIHVAAFTNLSRDHLDYHDSMEDYQEAKMRLFVEVMKPGGVAVLNADSDAFEAFRQTAEVRRQRVISYGREGEDIRLENTEPLADGQNLKLYVKGEHYDVTLPLVGDFQAENALCALGVVLANGEDAKAAVAALETLKEAPGRIQKVAVHPNGAGVFVDYAHTPEALLSVLGALRSHVEAHEGGRLVLVFGCGGDRDPGKRPEMGRIAKRLADDVIVTDDNPRSEDPAEIRKQILAACEGAREIGDRAEAITAALSRLGSKDILVVAGKGHETGQIVGDQILPFDDAKVIRSVLKEITS